jgi:hypothetical protein
MIYLNTLHYAITKGKQMKQLLTNTSISNIMFKNIPNYISFLNSLIAGFQLSVSVTERQKDKTDRGGRFRSSHGQHSLLLSWSALTIAVTVSTHHCSHSQHSLLQSWSALTIRTSNLTMKDNFQMMHYFATGST